MIAAAIELIFDVIFELIGAVVWWILLHWILVPFIYIVASPIVLAVALFGSGGYGERVRAGYRAVQDFCLAF